MTTEPMVRILSTSCSRCGENNDNPNPNLLSVASARHRAQNFVHGVMPPDSRYHRPDGSGFWYANSLMEVHCGGQLMMATEPVR